MKNNGIRRSGRKATALLWALLLSLLLVHAPAFAKTKAGEVESGSRTETLSGESGQKSRTGALSGESGQKSRMEVLSGESDQKSRTGALSGESGTGLGADLQTGTLQPSEGTKPAPSAGWTILVYMTGSNLESMYGSATEDLAEIRDAVSGLSEHILVYTGGARSWKSNVPSDRNCVYDMTLPVEDGAVAFTAENEDMGEPSCLIDFLNFAREYYPAEHTGLILWDHGSGPLFGSGNDELFDYDSLTLPEMDFAMSSVFSQGDDRLDFVGFDACLMSTLECMDVWRDYADFFVGSCETEPNGGWNYSFLSALKDQNLSAEELVRGIVSSYQESCEAAVTDSHDPDVTMAASDLSRLPEAEQAADKLLAHVTDQPDEGAETGSGQAAETAEAGSGQAAETTGAAGSESEQEDADAILRNANGGFLEAAIRARMDSRSYGLGSPLTSSLDLVDVGSLASHLEKLFPEEAAALSEAVKNLVISCYSNIDSCSGVSMYFPCNNKDQLLRTEESGQAEGTSTAIDLVLFSQGQRNFLDTMEKYWLPSGDMGWNLGFPDQTRDGLQLQLNSSQLSMFGSASYNIYENNSDGTEELLVRDCRLTPDEDGLLRVPADLGFFRICTDDTANQSMPIIACQIEQTPERAVYRCVVLLSGNINHLRGYDDADTTGVAIDFCEDLKDGSITIKSIEAQDDLAIAGKSEVDISKWVYVTNAYNAKVPIHDENGIMQPYDDWYECDRTSLDQLLLGRSLHIEKRMLSEEEADFSVQINLTDTYGHVYGSELVPVAGAGTQESVQRTEKGQITYLLYEDHAEVEQYEGEDTEIEIPDQVGGLPVTVIRDESIGELVANGLGIEGSTLESVKLPDTLTRIGKRAFLGCLKLKEITFPDSLKEIGSEAFVYCVNLQKVKLPDGLTSLGTGAFSYDLNLKSASLPSSLTYVGEGAFAGCESLEEIRMDQDAPGAKVRNHALYNGDGSVLLAWPAALREPAVVEPGTRVIGFAGFMEAKTESVTLPEGLKTIRTFAFYDCMNLTVPDFPDSLTEIGGHAFDVSENAISLPETESETEEDLAEEKAWAEAEVGTEAWAETEAESRYEYNHRDTSWYTGKVQTISIGKNLQNLGTGCFDLFPERTFEVSPDNPAYAAVDGNLTDKAGTVILGFALDQNLKIHVPDGIAAFDDASMGFLSNFNYMKDIVVDLYVPDSVERFPETASNFNFPADVTIHADKSSKAASYAAENGIRYEESGLQDGSEGEDAAGEDATSEESETDYNDYQDTGLSETRPDGTVYHYTIEDDEATLVWADVPYSDYQILDIPSELGDCPVTVVGDGDHNICLCAMEVHVPGTVRLIAPYSFVACLYLEKLDLSEGLKEIGDGAFAGQTDLKEIRLPDSLEKLGDNAFGYGYTSHDAEKEKPSPYTLHIGPNLRYIGSKVFADIKSIAAFDVDPANQTYHSVGGFLTDRTGSILLQCPAGFSGTVSVPAGIEVIGSNAFDQGNTVTDLYLPGSVRYIEPGAFPDDGSLNVIRQKQRRKIGS